MNTTANKNATVGLAALWILAALSGTAQTYDAAGDFSTNSNPNGVWSYGWSSSNSVNFSLYPIFETFVPLQSWHVPFGNPSLFFNPTTNLIASGTARFPARRLVFHPGASNEHSVVRWTSPFSGEVAAAAKFEGQDVFGTTTDITVYHNGTLLFSNLVTGFGLPSRIGFSNNLAVSLGDTIDFRAGYGNGYFTNDTTQIDVSIRRLHPYLTIAVADVDVCWDTEANKSYQLEYRSTLTTNLWVPFGAPIPGSGSRTCIVESVRGVPQKYFRVRED